MLVERKYWVPALERADLVLMAIAEQPGKLKLMDLVKHSGINKSTMFSLLQTMESLDWVIRQADDKYALASKFALWGHAYFSSYPLIESFAATAQSTVESIGETVQMAKLEKHEIVYMAKKEAPSPVRLISEPGTRMPAYATAMGKMLLSALPNQEILALFETTPMKQLTEHTLASPQSLLKQLQQIRRQGVAFDQEEAVVGFCCVAAPVYDRQKKMIAAVSVSMLTQHWKSKKENALAKIKMLAERLSIK